MVYSLNTKSKYLLKKLVKYVKQQTINSNTLKIISTLYEQLQKASLYTSRIDIKSRLQILNKIPKPNNFSYMQPEVKKNIINNLIFSVKYTFIFNEQNINIYFILDKEDISFTEKCVYKILLWLYILFNYINVRKSADIYFYMTTLHKFLPHDEKDEITKFHINSGYTSINEGTIVIFRKEEWFKVFIHESIHYFNLDFRTDNEIKKLILDMFPVKSKVNLYEAYTETWAKILNIIICSYFVTKDVDTYIDTFQILINMEQTYSFLQMIKILEFKNTDYNGILYGSDMYYENTHILSYFVITTILLNEYQKFMLFCVDNNQNLLDFNKTKTNKLKFVKLIRMLHKKESMFENIEYITNILQKNKDPYILQNTRLSICELD